MTSITVYNPYDRRAIADIPVTPRAVLEIALQQASALHREVDAHLPAHERIAILKRCTALMLAQRETLAATIVQEGGKPLQDARIEVSRAINGVELCVQALLYQRGQQLPMDLTAAGEGRMAFTYHEPIGPVVAVSAFNHPLNLIVHQVAPAIAAGCPVLVKPSNETPLSAQTFVQLLYDAGLEPRWCQFILSHRDDTQWLVSDPRTAFILYRLC